MEQAIISGVAHDRSEAKITVVGVPGQAGQGRRDLPGRRRAEINIDMIVQNVSAAATGLTDISFTLPKTDGAIAMSTLERIQAEVGFDVAALRRPDRQALAGRRRHAHAPRASPPPSSRRSPRPGVNIEMISTSEIRISVVTRADDVDAAVRAVHTAFGLDAPTRGRRLRRHRPLTGPAVDHVKRAYTRFSRRTTLEKRVANPLNVINAGRP